MRPLIAALVACSLSTGRGESSTNVTLDDLARRAEAIVLVTVADVRSSGGVTMLEVEVVETLKGHGGVPHRACVSPAVRWLPEGKGSGTRLILFLAADKAPWPLSRETKESRARACHDLRSLDVLGGPGWMPVVVRDTGAFVAIEDSDLDLETIEALAIRETQSDIAFRAVPLEPVLAMLRRR